MLKMLLVVVGVLTAVGGALYPVWRGVEARDAVQGLEQNIYRETSFIAYRPQMKEQGEANIAGWQQEIERKQRESFIWFGLATMPGLVGIGIASLAYLSPGSRKRKAPDDEPPPAPKETAAAETPGAQNQEE